MKQVLIIITVIILSFWYVGIGKEMYRSKKIIDNFSLKEVKELSKKVVLDQPINYNLQYFSKREVNYFYRRSLIPFIYNRDTISDSGTEYFQKLR